MWPSWSGIGAGLTRNAECRVTPGHHDLIGVHLPEPEELLLQERTQRRDVVDIHRLAAGLGRERIQESVVPLIPDPHRRDLDPFLGRFLRQLQAGGFVAVRSPVRQEDDMIHRIRVADLAQLVHAGRKPLVDFRSTAGLD
jgi:hypothetical protein